MQTNPFISFIQELFLRFSAKSPKFFVVWQWISGAVAAVSGIPATLTGIGITVPAPWNIFENKIIAIAGATALFMSLMPTQSKVIEKDSAGIPLKQTDQGKLPFTAQQEQKSSSPKQ